MNLNTKSELVTSLIKNLDLPKGSSLPDPMTFVGTDVTGSAEHIHAFEHQIDGSAVQSFKVYISYDSVTLQYEYSTTCFQPFSGSNHVDRAVEDVEKFLKRGRELTVDQEADRRQSCVPGLRSTTGEDSAEATGSRGLCRER